MSWGRNDVQQLGRPTNSDTNPTPQNLTIGQGKSWQARIGWIMLDHSLRLFKALWLLSTNKWHRCLYRMIPIWLIKATHSIWVYDNITAQMSRCHSVSSHQLHHFVPISKHLYRDNIALYLYTYWLTWWRHQMETFSALLAICAGNSPVPGEFPAQRPVTRSFDVFFHLRLNKHLNKQSWGWWFETVPPPLWRHSNGNYLHHDPTSVIDIMGLENSSLNWSGPLC